MKIVIVNGQNHKGSTYHIGRQLAEKLEGEITEIFLPRDFNQFCIGCTNCFMKSEELCPHYEQLKPLTQKLDEADVMIFTSPVYVLHATGSMKVFLDHYGYRFMIHRPEEKMFQKQAVCIATAAGGGMKSTIKDITDSMHFWGVAKVYKYGVAVRATSYENINEKIIRKIEKKTTSIAEKIKKHDGNVKPSAKTKLFFAVMRIAHKSEVNPADSMYWKRKGWTDNKKPWK